MTEKLTPEDINSIVYFIKEKSDLNRMSNYETMRKQIDVEFPDLTDALNRLKYAERQVAIEVRLLEEEASRREMKIENDARARGDRDNMLCPRCRGTMLSHMPYCPLRANQS